MSENWKRSPRRQKSMKSIYCISCLLALVVASCLGCSEAGQHYRDIADYQTVKSRFPSNKVAHFPESVPTGSKMYGFFVPFQRVDGLHLEVNCDPAAFNTLLAEAESSLDVPAQRISSEDPEYLENGEPAPRIYLDRDKIQLAPDDKIFRLQTGPVERGMIFRPDDHTIIYWLFDDD